MPNINLSKYQLIVTRSALIERLPEYREFRDNAPGIARGICEDHVTAMEEALAAINEALVAVGVAAESI